jgi:hypothetical protein
MTVRDGIEEMEPLATAKIEDYGHCDNIHSSITVRCILCIELTWRWLLEL